MSAASRDQGQIDFEEVARAALAACPRLLEELYPQGRRQGQEFCIGDIHGAPGDSLRVNLATGLWREFNGGATNHGGRDIIALYAARFGLQQPQAARMLMAKLGLDTARPDAPKPNVVQLPDWRPVLPVPTNALPPPKEHYRLGSPSHVAEVRGSDGALLHLICRFQISADHKEILPLTYGTQKGRTGWHWKGPPTPRPLYGLDRLQANPTEPVIVVEGEAKCDAGQRLVGSRAVVVSWPNGADGVGKADWAALRGRRVFVWPDADPPGAKAALDVVTALKSIAITTSIVPVPDGKDNGWDLADAEREGWTSEQVLGHLTRANGSAERTESGERPVIQIRGGEISREVDEAEAALIAAGAGIYQRGEILVRTGVVSVEISDDRTTQGLRIIPVEEHGLLEAMTKSACFKKYDGRSENWRDINCPMPLVKVYAARVGQWKLPILVGVISAPTMRPDGSLLTTPGYDARTGLLFAPCGQTFPEVPEKPTRDHAKIALQKLKKLIGTFPFVADADRSVALSALLTAVVRRSLRTAPLHGYTAPAAGTGKSKLADMASVMVTGREAGVIAQAEQDAETEKRLGAMFLAGEAVIAIDNCEHPLGGDFLCQAMTQPVVTIRPLGASKMISVPANSLVTATGNNLTLFGDMNRRALLCRLDAKCERPELREFNNDPVEDVKAERAEYVMAALTVLRAYAVAGRPKQSVPLGSFTEWSRWVRDALIWLDEADPASTMEETRQQDPAHESLSSVITVWSQSFGTGEVTVKDLIARAMEARTSQNWGRPEFVNPELRDALMAVAGRGGEINNRSLGKWLSKQRGKVVGTKRLAQGSTQDGNATRDGSALWHLQDVQTVGSHGR